MSKVKLPLYDVNGVELNQHVLISAEFFLRPQTSREFGSRIVENEIVSVEEEATDIPETPTTSEAVDNESIRIGWYEFVRLPSATTHIVYVGENSIYVPEDGVDPIEFFNAIDRGHAYRLVREVDVQG